jgi:hypothetical protein
MHAIKLSVITPGRKELRATSDLNGKRLTNAVTISGFEDGQVFNREDLLALARLFTGLAGMVGEGKAV